MNDSDLSLSHRAVAVVVAIMMVAGLTVAVGGPLILFWQIVRWLHDGVWPAMPLRYAWNWLGWPLPETEWVVPQRIMTWAFDAVPTVVALIFVGLLTSGVALRAIDVMGERAFQQKRAAQAIRDALEQARAPSMLDRRSCEPPGEGRGAS